MFQDLELSDGSSDYLKLAKGENRVRIVSGPIAVWTSFNREATGDEPKTRKFITEEGAKAFNATVPKDQQAKKRYAMWVLDRASDEILLAKFGSSIMKAVKALSLDSDYGFEGLPPYDIKITKTGEGLDTEYSVLNAPPVPLTEDEQKRVDAQQDLVEYLKQTAVDAKDYIPF